MLSLFCPSQTTSRLWGEGPLAPLTQQSKGKTSYPNRGDDANGACHHSWCGPVDRRYSGAILARGKVEEGPLGTCPALDHWHQIALAHAKLTAPTKREDAPMHLITFGSRPLDRRYSGGPRIRGNGKRDPLGFPLARGVCGFYRVGTQNRIAHACVLGPPHTECT